MRRAWCPPILVAATLSLLPAEVAAQTSSPQMIPAWIASTSLRPAKPRANELLGYDKQTVRQDIRVQTATSRVRLRLTNELGTTPVTIDQVTLREVMADGRLGRPVAATFAARESTTIEPGAVVYTDLTDFPVAAFSDVAIGVTYPSTSEPIAHRLPVRVAAAGTMAETSTPTVRGPAIVSAVETVATPASCRRVIVALGDSITEGAGSTANNDWPSMLARKLARQRCQIIVVNAGISGNRVLATGGSPGVLARLDRDVLAVPGVTDIIFLEGINDIRALEKDTSSAQEAAERLVAAYRQVVARAHAHGIRVIGGTLVPYKGTNNQSETGLAIVDATNAVIRRGGVFDAVIDFHRAMGNPADPQRMRADWQNGDWLHPNNAGYAAMAAAIPTSLFATSPRAR